jgi:Golgi SNAP receptor complex protein 2
MLIELLPEEKRKLHDLEQQLIELERGNTVIQPSDIVLGLQEIGIRLEEFEKQIQKETKAKKDDYRRRLQHLKSTHTHIKESLDNLIRRKGLTNYESQRAQLLAGKSSKSSDDIALEMAENGSLIRSSQMISEYLTMGQETLGELVSQRERLKSIQRKALDMFNYLGISNTLMKNVERRDIVDRWIVIGGAVLILGLLWYIWRYVMK